MIRVVASIAALLALTAAVPPSDPRLGIAEGTCRVDEQGPALRVAAEGMKDRKGLLKLEVYPANDQDFLADDNVLVGAGKTFRRVVMTPPAQGPVSLCIRVPGPGRYAVSLLHDRDANHRFSLSVDGVGFSRNPRLGLAKPHAADVAIVAGAAITPLAIMLNYRRGLLSFGPIGG